jgi:iron(III) transport system permease protein
MIAAAKFARSRITQQTAALTLLFVVVALLVVAPIVMLIGTSLSADGAIGFSIGQVSFTHYYRLLTSSDTLRVLGNTVVYALLSVAIGGALAAVLAWLTERSDMPGSVAVRSLIYSWMAIPPIVMAFGWVLLLNPGNGVVNLAIQSLFNLSAPPFALYSFATLVGITSLAVVPTAFTMLNGLLRNMDPQLEDAGRVLGSSGLTVARKISIPLLAPGLASVAMYLFVAVVQTFDFPLVIGLTAQIPVLSTRVFLLSSPVNGMPNYGLSAAFGVLLLVLAVGFMVGYLRLTRVSEKFRVVTGKAFRPRRVKLGVWRYPALLIPLAYFALMLLPVAILAWTSLFASYRPPTLSDLPLVSLDVYRRVLSSFRVENAVINTVLVLVSAATAVMLLSSLIAWFSVSGKSRWGKILDALSFAPLAIPPIVLVLAILILYLNTPLYGTIWILVLAQVTIYLAFGVRTMSTALLQIHKDLANAALVSGASWLTSLRKITIPIVWPQFVNGWLWVVAHSARDLTVPLMLMSAGNLVMATALWSFWEYPDVPGGAAIAILLVVGLTALVVPVQLLSAYRFDRAG